MSKVVLYLTFFLYFHFARSSYFSPTVPRSTNNARSNPLAVLFGGDNRFYGNHDHHGLYSHHGIISHGHEHNHGSHGPHEGNHVEIEELLEKIWALIKRVKILEEHIGLHEHNATTTTNIETCESGTKNVFFEGW